MPEEKVFPSEPDVSVADDDNDSEGSSLSEEIPDPTENADSIQMKQSGNKALLEFRSMVGDAILRNYVLGKCKGKSNSNANENLKEITLWGVPLLPSKGHEGTNIVLMKFLKAVDFKVSDAFTMLRRTLKWRREYDVDGILEENLDSGLENVVFINGEDKLGRPVCYTAFGAFRNRDFYKNKLGTEEKNEELLRRKVQSMEKGIRKLRFKPGGSDTILQITDLKNMPGSAMKELRSLNKQTMVLFEENYPELIFRNIFINVPFWYFVSHALHSKFISQSQRTKSKYIFARPSRVTQTLLKYITPENIPVQFGGLNREKDDEFSPGDKAVGASVSGIALQRIHIPVAEAGVTVVWDVTVVGFEVTYREEFIPDDDCSYNVLLQSDKKMRESVRNSFYIYEPGKIVITIDNGTSNKKKIFFRHTSKPTLPVYQLK